MNHIYTLRLRAYSKIKDLKLCSRYYINLINIMIKNYINYIEYTLYAWIIMIHDVYVKM